LDAISIPDDDSFNIVLNKSSHIALCYAKANVSGLIISSRTQSDLDTLTDEIRKINPKVDVLAQTCDTTKEDDVKKLFDATRNRFGRLDVCIANAGIISKYLADGSLPKGVVEDWDYERVIDINLLGTMRIARRFVPLLIESNGAKAFIVITSLAAVSCKHRQS
jgi:NAD(P)-dependent dehydrogenase (short-subunit alcohol dehydrogenase family)